MKGYEYGGTCSCTEAHAVARRRMQLHRGTNKYSHSVTLSLRKKRSGTYRFSFADTPKILVPTFFKELRGNICFTVGQV